jgi:hypothetical protein
VRLCDDAIRAYPEKRGKAIWEHRAVGFGAIPGRLRYETLSRAGFRCELCGISAEERALDVDHYLLGHGSVIPERSVGAPSSPW